MVPGTGRCCGRGAVVTGRVGRMGSVCAGRVPVAGALPVGVAPVGCDEEPADPAAGACAPAAEAEVLCVWLVLVSGSVSVLDGCAVAFPPLVSSPAGAAAVLSSALPLGKAINTVVPRTTAASRMSRISLIMM